MLIHSIKWRLQVWHGCLLIVLVSSLMGGFYTYESRVRLQAVDNVLLELLTPLMPKLGGPGEGRRPPRNFEEEFGMRERDPFNPDDPRRSPGREPQLNDRDFQRLSAADSYFMAWNRDGTTSAETTNAPSALPKPVFAGQQPGQMIRTRASFRELAHRLPSGAVVLVGKSIAPMKTELEKLAVALALIGVGIVIVGLAGGWWLAARALRPIAAISGAAQEIAAGDLSRRINSSETESELGHLATVLNSTFARLEAAFAQQQQFTSDAAHELRTPVSVILTQIQSTLNRERDGAEYRETLEACQRAAQRMRRLIESLLELARFDAGQSPLKRMAFDLNAVAEESAELLLPLAQQRNMVIVRETQSARTAGDPERIGQLITNLLTNAVNHGNAGGEIWLKTKSNGNSVILSVSDNGPGIPEEHLPKIFDRFYRADAARTSAQGRTGLGLAICKSIVQAHGGTIEARNRGEGGAEFVVRLPKAE
jgi:heavy metal sensor kinase